MNAHAKTSQIIKTSIFNSARLYHETWSERISCTMTTKTSLNLILHRSTWVWKFSLQCYLLMLQIFRACIVVVVVVMFLGISRLFFIKVLSPANPVKKSFFAPKPFVYGSSSVLDYKRRDVQPKKVKPHNYSRSYFCLRRCLKKGKKQR